ncbi:MAG: hypothetical protein COB02_07370 [Candidatus Cloacimonadota bacterium]|nr:MAG: hypothetical protein COB02_07370 [Candidatus Cloacimonadota bacterium]
MKKTLSIFIVLICIPFGITISSTYWRNYILANLFQASHKHESSLNYLSQASLVENDYIFPQLHYKAPTQFINKLQIKDLSNQEVYTDTLLKLINKNDKKLQNILPKAIDLLQKHGLQLLKKTKSKDQFLKLIEKIKQSNPNGSLSYYLKAKYFFKKKLYKKAKFEFEKASSRKPFFHSMLNDLFFIYLKNKEYSNIISLSEYIENSKSISPSLASYLGQSYYYLRQYKIAIKFLSLAIKKKNNYKVLLLLGKIGIRLNNDELSNKLLLAYEKNDKKISPLLDWLDFKYNKQDFSSILDFYDNNAITNRLFQKIILKTIATTGDYKRFEDFVGENSIDTKVFPIVLFYKAKTDLKNKKWSLAKENYLKFLNLSISSKYKKQIYTGLLECYKNLKDYQAILNISQKLLSLNPENINLYIDQSKAYFELKKSYQSLRILIAACDFFPENKKPLRYGVQLLKSDNSDFRLVNFLKRSPLTTRDLELGTELVRTALKTFQKNVAYVSLKKMMVNKKIREALDKDLISFYEDFKSNNNKEIEAQINLNQEYSDLVSQDKKYQSINKHQLPPSPNISRLVKIKAKFNKKYAYKGYALESIPEGRKVEIIEEAEVENSEDIWYLIRYRRNKFKIKEKYLDIKYYPNNESMGKAYISKVDKDYYAFGILSKTFNKNTNLTINAHHNSDLKKKIKFDDESWVKFGKIPTKTYTAEISNTTYRHILPEMVTLNTKYRFLKEHAFYNVVEVDIENKVALFGPNHAGVSIFQKDKSGFPVLLHKSIIEEKYSDRRTNQNFSDLLYKGFLVLDVNGDNILDFLSIWQSNSTKEKGIIHILSSSSIVSYKEFYLETDLSFIKRYKYVSKINPLLFLKNIDDDKKIEILSYQPLGKSGDIDNSIAWYNIYNIQNKSLINNSDKYPGFYEEQLYKLLDLYKAKKSINNGRLSNSFEDSYQEILSRIDSILQKVKYKL